MGGISLGNGRSAEGSVCGSQRSYLNSARDLFRKLRGYHVTVNNRSTSLYASEVMRRVLAWFRNDLRLLDNPALLYAVSRAGEGGEVWPVFCLDDARLNPNAQAEPEGGKEMDAHRIRFLLQSLDNLRKRLQAIGSDLLVVHAPARDALPAIIAATPGEPPALVVAQDEPAWPESQEKVAAALAQASLGELELVWGTTCFHRQDLPFREDLSDFPDSRGSFGVLAERAAHVHFPLPAPDRGSLGSWTALSSVTEALAARGLQVGIPDEERVLGAAAAAAAGDPLAVMEFVGGEDAGLERVEEYIWGNDENLEEYFNTRNGFLGRDFSSKFSPWLAVGCLSPRWCYWEVVHWERGDDWYRAAQQERENVSPPRGGQQAGSEEASLVWKHDEWRCTPPPHEKGVWPSRETGYGEGKGSYWMVFEFESRDFMHFMARKHGASLFSFGEGAGGDAAVDAETYERFRKWKMGVTGVPLVDACMRELARTGYLSNRGRMIAANFLCSDLRVPYWLGAQHFQNVCIDHDASINFGYFKGCARSFGHWAVASQTFGGIRSQDPPARAALAQEADEASKKAEDTRAAKAGQVEVGEGGLGRGGSDLLRQCYLYDADGTYIRTWVAELQNVPAPWCFAPWALASEEVGDKGSIKGEYPPPCVEVSWGITGGEGRSGAGASLPQCAPFHSFSPDRVMSGTEEGTLRFLDFDQAKIGGSLDLTRADQGQIIGEVHVRITKISEGVTYGAGGLSLGVTAADDLLPLTCGRCLGVAWGFCDNTLSFPRQQCAKCIPAGGGASTELLPPARTWFFPLSVCAYAHPRDGILFLLLGHAAVPVFCPLPPIPASSRRQAAIISVCLSVRPSVRNCVSVLLCALACVVNCFYEIHRGCEIPQAAAAQIAEGDVLGLVLRREDVTESVRILSSRPLC